jgi:hypothetical protein
MIDMKVKKGESGEAVMPASEDAYGYPYGLKVCVENEKIDELGIGALKVGDKVKFVAEGEVVLTTKEDYEGKVSRRCEIQIQSMEVDTGKEEGKDDINETSGNFFSSR